MLESVDPNAITPSTEALLPDAGAKGNKPPLPPLRLPSLPDEALPPVALAPIPLAAPAGAQPRSSGDQQHGTTATAPSLIQLLPKIPPGSPQLG